MAGLLLRSLLTQAGPAHRPVDVSSIRLMKDEGLHCSMPSWLDTRVVCRPVRDCLDGIQALRAHGVRLLAVSQLL